MVTEMLKYLCAAVLVASLGGQTIEELDEQYKAEVLEILPEDYESVGIGYLFDEAVIIADRIYSPYAGILGEMALYELSSLSVGDPVLLEGLVLRDSVDLEGLRLLDMLITEEGGDIDGYLYLLRFWNPAYAASYTKSLIIARIVTPAEYGGRTMAERLVPDEYLLLEGSPENPTVAIVSLKDVFTVELALNESGCYVPVLLKWYEEDVAYRTSFP